MIKNLIKLSMCISLSIFSTFEMFDKNNHIITPQLSDLVKNKNFPFFQHDIKTLKQDVLIYLKEYQYYIKFFRIMKSYEGENNIASIFNYSELRSIIDTIEYKMLSKICTICNKNQGPGLLGIKFNADHINIGGPYAPYIWDDYSNFLEAKKVSIHIRKEEFTKQNLFYAFRDEEYCNELVETSAIFVHKGILELNSQNPEYRLAISNPLNNSSIIVATGLYEQIAFIDKVDQLILINATCESIKGREFYSGGIEKQSVVLINSKCKKITNINTVIMKNSTIDNIQNIQNIYSDCDFHTANQASNIKIDKNMVDMFISSIAKKFNISL